MSIYLSSGTRVNIADETDLQVSSTLPVANYIVQVTPSGDFYLKRIDAFEQPKKYYGDVRPRSARIIGTYMSRIKSTGVLLSGVPGSGKTLLAREVCIECSKQGISTVIINEPYTGDKFSSFLASIDMECVIFFDEFEKVYNEEDQEAVLTIFDGTYTQKKLFLVTVNNVNKLVDPFISRPGRLYYHFKYDGVDHDFMVAYVNENVVNPEHREGLITLLSKLFVGASFDSMSSLVEEMNRYNEPAKEVMKYMNVQPTSEMKARFRVESDRYKTVSVVNDTVNDLFSDTDYGIRIAADELVDKDSDFKESVAEWEYFDVQKTLKSFDKETGIAYFEVDSYTFGKLKIEAWQEVQKVFNVMGAF
jgi:hypothetical protein